MHTLGKQGLHSQRVEGRVYRQYQAKLTAPLATEGMWAVPQNDMPILAHLLTCSECHFPTHLASPQCP